MGPANVPDTSVGRKVTRRAAHACAKCQKRKVRCDVSIRGSPCMNCYLDGEKCEVGRRSRRVRGRDRIQQFEAPRLATKSHEMQSTEHENKSDGKGFDSYNSKEHKPQGELGSAGDIWTMALSNVPAGLGATDKDGKPQQEDVITGNGPNLFSSTYHQTATAADLSDHGTNTVLNPTQIQREGQNETVTGVLSSHHHAPSLSNYIGYSYYQFLAVNNMASIPIQDYQFLELQGCLHVPVRPILDIFVNQYFLHMHPVLPILDEGKFWEMYNQRPNAQEPNHRFSLLVFQAMLFVCCNFVPQSTLSQLGLDTKRKARAVTYRRAKLLFDLEAESSSINKAQAALLLASWSFSSYEVPRKPNIPWLSIAVQHARDAEAHKYQSFSINSEGYAVRKRLWWCCIIRDRLFSLGMRRGIQITAAQFDVTHSSRLGCRDLTSEIHQSKVHDSVVKIKLIEVLELLVGLCIILTDILELAYPIGENVNKAHNNQEILHRLRNSQVALCNWHEEAAIRLPSPGTSDENVSEHNSVILFGNLIYMYYYLAKISLGHFRILQMATAAIPSSAGWDNMFVYKDNHFDLQNAALEMTGCLERLSRFRLIEWLPVTAVSCTALPLLLHILGTEIFCSKDAKDSSYSNLIKDRLQVLRTAMETYQFQYEGVSWITEVVNRVVTLSRTRITSPAGASIICPNEQSPMDGESWSGKLIFHPGWYLRLAFAVDVALSKGRLPEDQNFHRSFHELVLAEFGQNQDPSKRAWDEGKSSENIYCATREKQDDHSIAVYATESSKQAQLGPEPSYMITEVTDSSWETLLFNAQEPDETETGRKGSGGSRTNSSSPENMTVNGEDLERELDIFTLFSQEGLGGNGGSSIGVILPT